MRRTIIAALGVALLVAAALAAAGALAGCGGSSAANQTQNGPPGGSQPGQMMGDPIAMLTKQLDALVEKGTITSAQRTAVVAALKKQMGSGPPQGGQATPGAQPSPGAQPAQGQRPQGPGVTFTKALDTLVKDGTITGKQEKAIVAAFAAAMPQAPGGGQQPGGSSGQSQSY